MKNILALMAIIAMAYAGNITEQQYNETFENLANLAAQFGGEVPEHPTYEQFCVWYEQNKTQHCEK
jgi:hypothetical protein